MQQPPYLQAPRKITTEEVQWYLDENEKLILVIMENKNLRKLDKCAEYQKRLQQNLMYLAAIADWQHPQTQAMPQQMIPSLGTQAEYHAQRPQGVAIAQHQGIPPQNMPLQFRNPQQLHQQAIQEQMELSPEWINNGMYPMHSEAALGGVSSGGPPLTAGPNGELDGSIQGASVGGDGQGNSAGVKNIEQRTKSFSYFM